MLIPITDIETDVGRVLVVSKEILWGGTLGRDSFRGRRDTVPFSPFAILFTEWNAQFKIS